jgi:hypothetical protein
MKKIKDFFSIDYFDHKIVFLLTINCITFIRGIQQKSKIKVTVKIIS